MSGKDGVRRSNEEIADEVMATINQVCITCDADKCQESAKLAIIQGINEALTAEKAKSVGLVKALNKIAAYFELPPTDARDKFHPVRLHAGKALSEFGGK